jgi:phospholipid/cholesterol/gamma-HCH transport system permease protein
MHPTANTLPSRALIGPVSWVGQSVLAVPAYMGGVTLLALKAAGSVVRPGRRDTDELPGFWNILMQQLFWMLLFGFPLVGLIHIAMGSFLSLQAYYGSTFVDGTGAVVGVGLLRNLGGLMTGLTLAGMLAARMIPELRFLARDGTAGGGRDADADRDATHRPSTISASASPIFHARGRLAAPRIAAAAVACLFLSQWGITVGTLVGWQASQSMMGLSTETFFMMLLKMMWFRDVVGLIVKGLLFGALPAAICCFEGLGPGAFEDELAAASRIPPHPGHAVALPLATPVFRATCLSFVAILIANSSWFMLVYHAVPFYGPTLLAPPGP